MYRLPGVRSRRLAALLTTLTCGVAAAAAAAPPAAAASAPALRGPTVVASVSAHHRGPALRLRRSGPGRVLPLVVRRSGEGLLDLVSVAPGADWGTSGAEAATVSVFVDGHYDTDIVIPSAQGIRRQFALGSLRRGIHHLTFRLAADRTAAHVHEADLRDIGVRTVDAHDADYLALRYAPVLYGRNLAAYGGPLDNAVSDTPLVAWHDVSPAATPGHVVLQVSYVWSNEDGGTDTSRLMARWGRTTDIEWIYRVELDAHGDRVPGSDTFQAPAHTTTTFHGRYEGTHAVLDTCTENNNVCDTVNDPMRFFLDDSQTLPAGLPREAIMDANPWTYQVMAAEMHREGKVEATASPDTPQLSDQRDYLFLALQKTTVPSANSGASWVGVSVGVTLRGSARVYRSDHLGTGGATDWSIQRDDPAATTVELPPGTTAADVASIQVIRVVNGGTDPGNAVHVTRLIRGFFLDRAYRPGTSFVHADVDATLTAANPTATVWQAPRSA